MTTPLQPVLDPARLRVLLIDDQSFVRHLLRAVLTECGVGELREAASSEEAEVLLRDEEPFDLIFCDLQLPGRDGIDLLRGFPTLAERSAVVFLSGEDERILRSVAALGRAHGIRVLGALRKPVNPDDVCAVLDALATTLARAAKRGALPPLDAKRIGMLLQEGHCTLHYQPKVRLRDRAVVGFEALMRVADPEHGAIPPDHLMAQAVPQRLVDSIAAWTIREGVAAAGRWQRLGLDAGIAVNVNGRSLTCLHLPDLLQESATAAGLPMEKVTVEITETEVAADLASALDITTRFRLKRARLSIDDFGMGVSGLRQLQQMPFSELKLDRAFVDQCDRDEGNRVIVHAGIALAHALDMQVVGEGVERPEEWETLAHLGCDIAQGYFVAQAMPEAAILDWVAEWHAG